MNVVPSAARVLDLLEFLAGSDRGASLTAAASSLQLAKSSTLMLLRTLVARGYVVRSDGDLYVLNDTFRRHGFAWGGSRFARLVAVARPVMESLCEQLGETVILGVLTDDGHVRLLAKVIARQDIRYDVDITTPLPAYCTAMGRVLLGSLPQDRQAEILNGGDRTKRTPDTVTDLNQLDELVDRAATNGYSIVEEEFALGGTGVSAPLVDSDGRIIAALDVACITTRFQGKRNNIVSAVVAAAANLSSLLAGSSGARRPARNSLRRAGAVVKSSEAPKP
jgi:DNA-binding IclR family transcriptional regulator